MLRFGEPDTAGATCHVETVEGQTSALRVRPASLDAEADVWAVGGTVKSRWVAKGAIPRGCAAYAPSDISWNSPCQLWYQTAPLKAFTESMPSMRPSWTVCRV